MKKILLGGHKVRKVQILYRYKLALTVDLDCLVLTVFFPKRTRPNFQKIKFFFFFFFNPQFGVFEFHLGKKSGYFGWGSSRYSATWKKGFLALVRSTFPRVSGTTLGLKNREKWLLLFSETGRSLENQGEVCANKID